MATQRQNTPKSKQKAKTQDKAPEPVVLDRSIKNDRSVELRGHVDLTPSVVYQIQRAFVFQNIAKNGEKSSLKFYLGPSDSNKYRFQDQAALADTYVLLNTPVDVIIKSGIGPDVLKAFLSATGKRYMYAGAKLHMGVITHTAPYGKNKANQVRRQLFNEYKIDLQNLVMEKSGETDRQKVFQDLLSAKGYNAMEALYYGKKGLIDGILIGHHQVITRADLEAFYKQQGWDKKRHKAEIEAFNKDYIHVYRLPTRDLEGFAPVSLPTGTLSFYKSLRKPSSKEKGKDKDEKDKKDGESQESKQSEKKTLKASTKSATVSKDKPEDEKKDPPGPIFFVGEKKLDELPLLAKASKEKPPARMMVEQVPSILQGILEDDAIFFNDGFNDETAEQIGEALVALDHKKIRHPKASHIKIVENSPGGSVWSGQELRSLIKSLMTPVDVIVQGMGASCGSWLLCSATGNRFATPNARIMFHEAATEIRHQTPANHFNEMHDGLDQSTLDYIAIVAEATGRDFDEVLKDFDNDVWLNPLQALYYGDKGLIDAILVGENRVITRSIADAYLVKHFGTKAKLNQYWASKLQEKRDPRLAMDWSPEKHRDDDPFDNPLRTIQAIAQHGAKPITSLKTLAASLPQSQEPRTIDFFNVVIDEEKRRS